MKKFRVKSYETNLGKRHSVQMRHLLFLWTDLKSFINEDDAKQFCDKLNLEGRTPTTRELAN